MQSEQPPMSDREAEEVVTAELDLPTDQDNSPTFIERLLSPESLQWMMACGSGLLVLGFVIWLWSVGVFENPVVIAASSGIATLGLISSGMGLVLKTRHQLAGQWLTLLGAVALPLNLWLYDAQGLITLANGGHLWIPAALCCVIYAGIARVLRDAKFVYALVGGIVLTGMLFLADQTIGRFWEWLPPAKFLLTIGWLSVFAERLFVDEKSDFSRANFGAAFFRAGMIVVVSGLALLFGGFVSLAVNSIFVGDLVFQSNLFALTSITTAQKFWALGLVSASAVGFSIQGYLRNSTRCYWAVVGMLVWAFLIGKNILGIPTTVASIGIAASSLVTGVNLWQARLRSRVVPADASACNNVALITSGFAIAALILLAVGQSVLYISDPKTFAVATPTWWTVLQFALTAAASWSVAWNIVQTQKTGKTNDFRATGFAAAGSVAAVLAPWAAALVYGGIPLTITSMIILVLPVAFALASWFPADNRRGIEFAQMGSAMMFAHLVLMGLSMLSWILLPASQLHIAWGLALGVASLVWLIASRERNIAVNSVLSTFAAVGSIGVLGHYFGFEFGHCIVLAPMILGTGIKLYHSIAGDHKVEHGIVKQSPVVNAANFLVLLAGVSAVLMSMSFWLDNSVEMPLMIVMLLTLCCTVFSSFLTRNRNWRNAFRALIVAIAGCTVCVFDGLLNIDGWHRAELCCLVGGVILLILGHVAWRREDDIDADAVATISLFLGSLMVALPVAIGLVHYRITGDPADVGWRWFHELAAISASLLMLGSGIICRIRSTTIGGAGLMVAFVASLLLLIRVPDQLQNASVMMMVGGAVFLATAVMMSIYRDRLMGLPKQVRDGEGVFQVLKWR